MKNLLLPIILGLIFIWGCSNEFMDNPINSNQSKGKIQLKIDRENAPVDVVLVLAILTREGYEPITGTLNLQSDSTADLTLDEIPAGHWHLKVDALDNEGIVLYTGETEVEIFAGFVTQVNLVLNPTGDGTGTIYIFVTWGIHTNSNWIDFIHNPVLISSNGPYDHLGVSQPVVLYENNQYKMWYTGDQGTAVHHVLYAESIDGISWERPLSEPVLYPGPPDAWDSYSVHPHSILKEGELLKLFYSAWTNPYGRWDIGFATSYDGINWEKYPHPILQGTSGWEYQVASAAVIKHNETYYLYYTGRNLPELKIGLATSSDGIHWTRYENNPVLTYTEPWEENGVYSPTVVRENDQFKMIYMNSSGNAFGIAYSSDGMHWTKNDSNPFFTTENTANGWAANKIAYPNLIKINNEWRFYYSGIENQGEIFRIGFAKKIGELF